MHGELGCVITSHVFLALVNHEGITTMLLLLFVGLLELLSISNETNLNTKF